MASRRLIIRSLRTTRAGFTLVEALVSITIAALASSALYLGLIGTLQTTQHSLEQTIANGIAEQIIDEVLGQTYVTGNNPLQAVLCADAWELAGTHRERFNDIDDYNGSGDGLKVAPPKDMYGVTLGNDDGTGSLRHPNFRAPATYLANWQEEIDVYYVNESNTSQKVTSAPYSNLRAVEVRIYAIESPSRKRLITQVKRIHGYVPPPL